jgi:adenylate cyclase
MSEAKRRLAAILSADVAGYSRLMGSDEEGTITTLKDCRDVFRSAIGAHYGRVVDTAGDSVLAVFESVVEAVRCAIEVQDQLVKVNQDRPEDRRMLFRIGVNLGDIVEEQDGKVYGDGVNVAARLEALARPAGLVISGTAFDQVDDKLDYVFASMGEQTVKNIARPIRAYRLDQETTVDGTVETPALPAKPSIAVLPFTNMSGDTEQDYFADGITEDLITDLSRFSGLFVIARHSSYAFKNTTSNMREIGSELGVRYLVEGSIRKFGPQVRITAQLIDAVTGGHLWADRYDGNLQDVFELQDKVTQKIIAALAVRMSDAELARVKRIDTDDMGAFDCVLRGQAYFHRYTKEANATARSHFIQASERDPGYARAFSNLSRTYLTDWRNGWSDDRADSLERASRLAKTALDLDRTDTDAMTALGDASLWGKDHALAVAMLEEAVASNPNDADGHLYLGETLTWSGNGREAIKHIETAMRLNPRYPFIYKFLLGHAHFVVGEVERTIQLLEEVRAIEPQFEPTSVFLAASYGKNGRIDDAAVALKDALGTFSNLEFSRKGIAEFLPYKEESDLLNLIDGLHKAGLPE